MAKEKNKTEMSLNILQQQRAYKKEQDARKSKEADANARLERRQARKRKYPTASYQALKGLNDAEYIQNQIKEKEKRYGAAYGSSEYKRKNDEEYTNIQKNKAKAKKYVDKVGSFVRKLTAKK